MKPQGAFKELINTLKPFFKFYNYLKKGNSFYYLKEGNCGLIAFQKSRTSNISEVIFTINLGIYSQVVANFFKPERIILPPSIGDCHWSKRIAIELSPFQGKWWSIDDHTSIPQLCDEITYYLRKSIAEIDKYISDRELQSLWLSGQSYGITNLHRLMNLSVLLKHSGDTVQLELVKEELKKISEGTPSEFVAKLHLSSL